MCPLNFSAFFCRSLTLHQSLMWATILKPIVRRGCNIVWRLISLSVAQKQWLVGCREHLGIKDSKFESKVLHSFKTANWNKKKDCEKSVKKYFFLRKFTKMSNLILCFSKISDIFICVYVRQGAFFIWELKMLSVWSSVLFTVFCFRNAWKESIQKTNVTVLLNKAALEHDRFKQVSLDTTSWLFASSEVSVINAIMSVAD